MTRTLNQEPAAEPRGRRNMMVDMMVSMMSMVDMVGIIICGWRRRK